MNLNLKSLATMLAMLITSGCYAKKYINLKYLSSPCNIKKVEIKNANIIYSNCINREESGKISHIDLYKALTKEFRNIEFSTTQNDWIKKAYILDAIDTLTLKYPTLNPISPRKNFYKEIPVKFNKKEMVPLVNYDNIKFASGQILNSKQIPNHFNLSYILKDSLQIEKSSTAEILELITTTKISPFRIGSSKTISRIMTYFSGKQNLKKVSSKKIINKISKSSVKLQIPSIEKTVHSIDTKINYIYRGPKYLFGRQIHQFKSVNDWFARGLTKSATNDYLKKANYFEEKISNILKTPPTEAVIVSNSNSRVRIKKLRSGMIGLPQHITGKVLSRSSARIAKKNKDNPIYYKRKYTFSLKELFGGRNSINETMSIVQVRNINYNNFSTRNVYQAQVELLKSIYRSLDQIGVIQVTQRLSPSDIHSYIAPTTGHALSNLQAVQFLKRYKEQYANYFRETNNRFKLSIENKEIEHLNRLEKIFKIQEHRLGRSSQKTIDIYGTNLSVSTNATRYRSNILAQNDRKVMLFKHLDNSFSVHIFIGATAVNKVDVNPLKSYLTRGDKQGDMQYGQDRYQANSNNLIKKSKDKTTRDGLKKLTKGDFLGRFPINGSTVISLYLPNYTLKKEVKEFFDVAKYIDNRYNKKFEIEIKASIGDPLLISTAHNLALQKQFNNTNMINNESDAAKLVRELRNNRTPINKIILNTYLNLIK